MESPVQEPVEEESAETETLQLTGTVELEGETCNQGPAPAQPLVELEGENSNQEPAPAQPETQRRSQRERRPKETLTYDILGQPTHRVVELHNSPVYVDTQRPANGQHGVPWGVPYCWGPQMIHTIPVPIGYY